MSDITNVLIVGVGGQGTILASRVLAGVLQREGLDVKVSEIHGMAQRGGSVVTQVRFGSKVSSPIIPQSEANIILAFEKLEALRWIDSLKEDGYILVNDQRIDPMPVVTGVAKYPENVMDSLKQACKNVIVIDALQKAVDSGSSKTVNVVLLGLLSAYLDFDWQIWIDALTENVPPKLLDVNIKAFLAGRLAAEKR